jgi:predicted NBD/HSP70 family sugar kinase
MRLTAGVDLGGTKIQTVAVRDEQVVGSARVPTPQTGDATDGHRWR